VLEHEPRLGGAGGQPGDDRHAVVGRGPVLGHVDDRVDLRSPEAGRVEEIRHGTVTRQVGPCIGEAGRVGRQEAVEGAGRRAVPHAEDGLDGLVVDQGLDDAPPEGLVGVGDENSHCDLALSTSTWTERRVWFAR